MVASDQNFGKVVVARITDERLDDIAAGQIRGLGARFPCQLQIVVNMLAADFGKRAQLRRLDINHMPRYIQFCRDARCAAHNAVAARPRPDAGQQRFARLPYRGHGLVAPVLEHLDVHTVRSAAQRQLAQCDQIALAEEILNRAFGLVRQVDLAFFQALQQFVRRQVHQHHFVGRIEHMVGNGLPHADAGDAADHVVEGFQVLDVDRRIDIDAGGQQLLHILPAFGMARAGDVGVRQLIHQDQRGLARERTVQIELGQHLAAIGHLLERQALKTFDQRLGFLPAVGLHHADDDIHPYLRLLARGGKHRIGLADACGSAEKYLELARAARACCSFMRESSSSGLGR